MSFIDRRIDVDLDMSAPPPEERPLSRRVRLVCAVGSTSALWALIFTAFIRF